MGKRTDKPSRRRLKVRRRLSVERLDERRVLAAITGAVFNDANHSFQKDAGEENVARRIVYIDANDSASLDVGESFVVAKPDGTFEFQNLDDGSYLLRLFNGTQSQIQKTPIEATFEGDAVSVSNAFQLEVGDGSGLALTTDSLVTGDLTSGDAQAIAVGEQLSRMQTLPNGKVLIVGTDAGSDTSWMVDPETQSVTAEVLIDGVLI